VINGVTLQTSISDTIGQLNNTGKIVVLKGGILNNFGLDHLYNYGNITIEHGGALYNYGSTIINTNGAFVQNGGEIENQGGTILNDAASSFTITAGGDLYFNRGSSFSNFGILVDNGSWEVTGGIYNNATGEIINNAVLSLDGEFGAPDIHFTNYGQVLNSAGANLTLYNGAGLANYGLVSNAGNLAYFGGTVANQPSGVINNLITGLVDPSFLNNSGIINNYGSFESSTSASVTNAGTITDFCNAVFNTNPPNTYSGTPIVTIPCSAFPITWMSDTTASGGTSVYAKKQMSTEFVSITSALKGRQIDSMSLQLDRVGHPTGAVQVGVFAPDLSLKQLFGSIDASSLSTTYTNYAFQLPNNQLYTIQSGDYIGVKFAGGDSSNYVMVMRDWSNKFDGTNSFRAWYNTTWWNYLGDDLDMVLKQTHPVLKAPEAISITSTSNLSPRWGVDTVSISGTTTNSVSSDSVSVNWGDGSTTSGIAISSGTWTSPTHTYSASAVGSRTIAATLGNSSMSVKATSNSVSVTVQRHATSASLVLSSTTIPAGSTITASGILVDSDAANAKISGSSITFTGTGAVNLASTITNGTGGYSSAGPSPNTVANGWTVQAHYAGNASYAPTDSPAVSYTTSAIGLSYPITQMSDTTASGGTSVYSAKQADMELVTNTSALVGKPIDLITMRMAKSGSPTGILQVGVFSKNLAVKTLFGTLNASAITGTYSNYTFQLSNNQLYTIQSGDYIGVKYTGGNSLNYILVMRDWLNKFDGTNSFRSWYNTTWWNYTGDDLYMTLKQTHPASLYPLTVMDDQAASGTTPVYFGHHLDAESFTGASVAVNKKIDTITLQLAKTGNVQGPVAIGIFHRNLSTYKAYYNGTWNYNSQPNALIDLSMVLENSQLRSSHESVVMYEPTSYQPVSVYSAKSVEAEYITNTSSIVNKQIDTITLQLSKVNNPTGTFQIGVFNPDTSVKQLFGTMNASALTSTSTSYPFQLPSKLLYTIQSGDYIGIRFTGGDASNYILVMTDFEHRDGKDLQLFGSIDTSELTSTPTKYSFQLPNNALYTIQAGDWIGVKYNGGDASNYISVMRDATNKFDGTNAERVIYGLQYIVYMQGDDLTMTLQQTHG
jgi:hypothetical protein